MTFATFACKANLTEYSIRHPNQPEHDMTSFVKAAGLAGILAVVLTTVSPELKADQLNNAVREGHAVTTELGASASAITYWVSDTDGWHVVTTVDVVIGRDGDAE